MRHARPVGVAQQLVAHVPGEVERAELQLRVLDPGDRRLQAACGVQLREALLRLGGVHEPRDLPRHVEGAVQHVGGRHCAAVLKERCGLGLAEPSGDRRPEHAHACAEARHRAGNAQPTEHLRDAAVVLVAAEELVAADARQHDLQARIACRLRDEVRVHRVDGRLVHRVKDGLQLALEVGARDGDGAMVGADQARHVLGER